MKKITVAFLVMVMLFLCGIAVFAEDAADDTGEWSFDTYGDGVVLTAYHGDQTDVYVPNIIDVGGESKNVLKLGDNLFNGSSINSATLGEGIIEIGENTFANNASIVCIVTPESLTTIGANAFSGCTAFNSIILYDAVTSIGEDAFSGCDSLTIYCNENTVGYDYAVAKNIDYEILNPEATPEIVFLDGIEYYIMNGEAIAVSFDGSRTEVVVPSNVNGYPVTELRGTFRDQNKLLKVKISLSVKRIGEYTFYNCWELNDVQIPKSVNHIGKYAFYKCVQIKEINISDNVTYIGGYAFYECRKLQNLPISKRMTQIGSYTFYGCNSLINIEIPDNIVKIFPTAFNECANLKTVKIAKSVQEMASAFPTIKTIFLVYEGSYAYDYVVQNDYLYYVIKDEIDAPKTYMVDGIEYYIQNNDAIAISYKGEYENIVIPSEIEGCAVTEIRSGVFRYANI